MRTLMHAILRTPRAWLLGLTLALALGPASPVATWHAHAADEPAHANDDGHDHADHADHADEDHAGDAHGDEDNRSIAEKLLVPNPGAVIWNLLVFLILLAVLGKFVWPKILAGLNAREAKLHSDLTAAETANAQAQELLTKYQGQLAEAQKEYQRVVDGAKGDALTAAAKVKADAETELAAVKARAEADIQSAKEQAVADIYEQAAVLSTDIAGKVLQREIRPEDHRALIDESLAKLN